MFGEGLTTPGSAYNSPRPMTTGLGSLMQPGINQALPTTPRTPAPMNPQVAPPAAGPEMDQLAKIRNIFSQMQDPAQRANFAQVLAQQFAPPPTGTMPFGNIPQPGQTPQIAPPSFGMQVSPQGQMPQTGNPFQQILQYIASQRGGV